MPPYLRPSSKRNAPSLADTLNFGWVQFATTGQAVYASGTTFTMTGDYTAYFTRGRRLRIYHATSAAYKYVTVVSSSYGAPTTTVTVLGDTLLNETYASLWIDFAPASFPNLVMADDGWIPINATLTYASADSPTFTFTIPGDWTDRIGVGARIKLTQTTAKYFIVTAISYSSSTTVSVYGGTDYTLANAAITGPYYSREKAPLGFPLTPASWTVTAIDTTNRTTNSAVAGTWYNATSITLPIGSWRVSYNIVLVGRTADAIDVVDIFSTLSTANNSESDVNWTHTADLFADAASAASNARLHVPAYRDGFLTVTSKTTYYLNYKTSRAGTTTIGLSNAATEGAPCIQKATSAYL